MAKERDAFFTPRDTSKRIVEWVLEEYPETQGKDFYEPSAGDGSFIDAVKSVGLNIEGADIHPMREDVVDRDFLTANVDLTDKIVIGNPPYGFRHQLAGAFINRSFELGADMVVFLLLGNSLNYSFIKYYKQYVDKVKLVDTGFLTPDGKAFTPLRLVEPVLIVFKKDLENGGRDDVDFDSAPFISRVALEDDVKGEHIVAFSGGDAPYYRDFNKELAPHPVGRHRGYRNFHENGKLKTASVYQFLGEHDLKFFNDLKRVFSGFSGKGVPRTFNYWYVNRDKIDFTPL